MQLSDVVISRCKNIKNKSTSIFMQFDIEEIYPLVSKDLLLNVIIKQKVLLISAMTKQKPLRTQESFSFQ